MGVADKLEQMAQYATQVQDVMDKEVELLEFCKTKDEKERHAAAESRRKARAS